MAAPSAPRLFLAVGLSEPQQATLLRWRQWALAPVLAQGLGQPVAARNLHLTLAFLGATPPQLADELLPRLDLVRAAPYTIAFDQCQYWPKPRIAALTASSVAPALLDLANQLRTISQQLGLHRDSQPYQPHITLCRELATLPELPETPPSLTLTIDHFTLFDSRRVNGELRYQPLARWPLRAPAGGPKD